MLVTERAKFDHLAKFVTDKNSLQIGTSAKKRDLSLLVQKQKNRREL